MTQPAYRFPAIEMKTALVARITNVSNGIYGSGTITGSISPSTPQTQKIRAIYDASAPEGAPLPRFVWGKKDGDPDADGSTTFHAAGISWSIEGHVYSGRFTDSNEVDELCDRLVSLHNGKVVSLPGSLVCRQLHCRVVTIIPDPVGMHGILSFEAEIQNR